MLQPKLKTFTINMKDLTQEIEDPILSNVNDAQGRTLRILFTQEAAAQFADNTKVYLKWKHAQTGVEGLNVFTRISEQSCTNAEVWEIKWPQAMLHKGDALCCIELVDDISIASSQNFTVHILQDPHNGGHFVVTDDYDEFKKATIELATLGAKAKEQMAQYEKQFQEWHVDMENVKKMAQQAYDTATNVESHFDEIIKKGVGLYIQEV